MKIALKALVALMLALTSLALPPSSSFAAEPTQTVWSAEAIARSNSELSVLLDGKNQAVYTIKVPRLKRVLKALDRLQIAAGTTARLWLVHSEDNAPNAFAYFKDGGSQIIITTSVLDILGDDLDAYAFLMGHEIGHIVKEHGLQRQYLAQMMKLSRALSPAEFSGRFGHEIKDEANVSAVIYGAAFDRDQERQADRLSLDYMMSAGFDPRGALRLFRAMMSSPRSELPTFLSTHPNNEERLSNIEKIVIDASANPADRGRTSTRRTNIVMESGLSVFSPGDEELARIAEVMAVIKREFVFPVDDHQLIAGCRYGLVPETSLESDSSAELSLNDIVNAISSTRKTPSSKPAREQTDSCLDGMISALDRRSRRIDADEVRKFQSPVPIAGIGIELAMQDEMPSIVSVVEGGPAERAQLKSGGLLTYIDGISTKGLAIRQVFNRLRGAPGSTVTITIESPGSEATQVKLTRAVIKLSSVDSYVLPSGYGYIKIRYFGPRTLHLLGTVLGSLEENAQIRGLVLDLRNNAGGTLYSCVGVAAAFLGENLLIADTKGRTNDSKLRLVSSPSSYVPPGSANPLANLPQRMKTLPMAVLVNNDTAACSEIVAAALQDHKRAFIIGYRTKGLGAVTNNFPLRNNDVLKLTTALFNRSSGDTITDVGVIPDFTLPSPSEGMKTNDFQLDETVRVLSDQMQ